MSLIRNVGTIGGLTAVSRVFGFARDMILARVLGAGLAADAFQLAFTLPKRSPSHTGTLSDAHYRDIFSDTVGGRYGHTLDYARQTLESLRALGIRDRALEKLLAHASA